MLHCAEFDGLEGTTGIVEAPFVSSPTEAIRVLRKYQAITVAGDFGSTTAWRDYNGKLKANFQRWCVVVDEAEFKSLRKLTEWLKIWVPAVHQNPETE